MQTLYNTFMDCAFFLLLQKLEARKSALERTSALTNEQKERWRQVLVTNFISSEESGEEEIDGDVQQYLYVKLLPWRDRKVNKFMKSMDDKIKKKQSLRARRQTLPRLYRGVSTRPKTTDVFAENFWGFTAQN